MIDPPPAIASSGMRLTGVHFEHYTASDQLGTHIRRPRLSWTFTDAPDGFVQLGYEIELYDRDPATSAGDAALPAIHSTRRESADNLLVPWPLERGLEPRERLFARVRAWGTSRGGRTTTTTPEKEFESTICSPWSESASIEGALFDRRLWQAQLISAPWAYPEDTPQPEELFRRQFTLDTDQPIRAARLYITAQGVYEAEINGERIGDHFMAPGWTAYGARLCYQCYDVLKHLRQGQRGSGSSGSINVLGARVAEGWFCGRLSWGGGARNMFGERPALLAQLEVTYDDGTVVVAAATDESWTVAKGPAVKAEIYDGEKYDARLEIDDWSRPVPGDDDENTSCGSKWETVVSLGELPASIDLVVEEAELVRRLETVRAVQQLLTPSGKVVLDFGQNLVGHTRITVQGAAGTTISLRHAEVLENGELGTRPLRQAANCDVYTLRGTGAPEQWQPRFTFHGFRYVEVDGWPQPQTGDKTLLECIEAVVCHTDMARTGSFTCSDPLLSRFHENVVWSMRGNFFSVPTDCPQRDERLGWTGDLAVFAPTATMLYRCSAMLQGWLRDVAADQATTGGVVPMVVPNVLKKDPIFGGRVMPAAIWGDVAVLGPWALYQATGDVDILREQYPSMRAWITAIPRNKTGNTHLWDNTLPQLGDWLDPTAPPDNPAGGKTDAILVADAFLIQTLGIMAEVAQVVGSSDQAQAYLADQTAARAQFAYEYICASGRMMSDSQTAYALAIMGDLFPTKAQRDRAGDRLVEIVRRNAFKVGTGFAGTPYICEALTRIGRPQVAYAMMSNKACPSWLYPVTMGATTVWERFDSMLPDSSINPGEMTSFNHYALGAVALWLWERAAGLQCAAPGWKRLKIAPVVGGGLTHAQAQHETPYGLALSSWRLVKDNGDTGGDDSKETKNTPELLMEIIIPPNTSAQIEFPAGSTLAPREVGAGKYSFRLTIDKPEWPIEPIRLF